MLVAQLASAASARRGVPATAEEAAAYLDLANGDVTAALLEMCDDAAWESRSNVAHAFERPQRGPSFSRERDALPVSSSSGGAPFGAGLLARISGAVAAVGGGGGGGGGEKQD